MTKAAYHYLSRYDTSVANLRAVLERRVLRAARIETVDEDKARQDIEQVLSKLVGLGLLNDEAFAAARARSLHRRGSSSRAIQARLTQLGLDAELIAPAIAQRNEDSADPELSAAITFARRRRLGPYRSGDDRAERRERDLAALGRQGFTYDIALKVVDAEDIEVLQAEARGDL